MRHHIGTALILGAAALAAVALHNLDLSPQVHDAMRGRSGMEGIQLRSIDGWSYRHTDPETGDLVWQAWGREAKPLGGGHDTWRIHDPRLVVPQLGEADAALILSARIAVLSRRGRSRDVVQLDDGVELEWGSIHAGTERVLVEVREDDAAGERSPTAVADRRVEITLGGAGAPAELEADGMRVHAAANHAVLAPPVSMQLPARALDEAAGTRLVGRLVRAPGAPPREVAPGDTLRVVTEHPVELRERAPGHVETRFTGPFRLELSFADGTPPLELDAADAGVFTVGAHPPRGAALRHEIALEALELEGGRLTQPGRLSGAARLLTMGPDGRVTLTGDADAPVDLTWNGSRVRAHRVVYLPESGVLVLDGDVDATLAPELLPERLRARAAGDGLRALSDPWRVEADRVVAGLDPRGRLKHLSLEGRGRHARLASRTPADAGRGAVVVEGERITLSLEGGLDDTRTEREQLAALRVAVEPRPGSRSLGTIEIGGDRLTAERIVVSGRDSRALATGRVTVVRSGAGGREDLRAQGETLDLALAITEDVGPDGAPRVGLSPRALSLTGPDGVELRLHPEALLAGPDGAAPAERRRPPLELVAGRVEARFDEATAGGSARPRLAAVEARAGAGRRVRLTNPSAQPLADRLGVELGAAAQGAGAAPIAGPEREWVEADRAELSFETGRASLSGQVRGLLAAPLSAEIAAGDGEAHEPPVLLQLAMETFELGLDGPLGQGARPGLAHVEATGRPGAPARVESLSPVPLSVRTGLLAPGTGTGTSDAGEGPAAAALLAGGEREWLAAPRIRFDAREQALGLRGGVRGRLGLALPEELFFAAGAEGEGGRLSLSDLEAETVRLGFTQGAAAAGGPSLSWLLAEGGVRVRDGRNDIRAERVRYRHTERTLVLAGPPLEVIASGGRYRWSPGGEVRIRLADSNGGE